MNNRVSPEYVLLGLLCLQPCHGYELYKRINTDLGQIWRISQSQLYNILNRLEAQGYIRSTVVGQEKLPTRRLFELTGTGMQRFNAWLETPTRCSVHAIRVEFITRLYFIQQLTPHKTQHMIQRQVEEVQGCIDRLEKTNQGLPDDQKYTRLALELRISLLDSIVSWLDSCQGAFSVNESGEKAHA